MFLEVDAEGDSETSEVMLLRFMLLTKLHGRSVHGQSAEIGNFRGFLTIQTSLEIGFAIDAIGHGAYV